MKGSAQYGIHYDSDHLPSLRFGPEKIEEFNITLSVVAMYTTGVEDRNGFRLGIGLHLSQTINKWTLLAGLDMYKEKQTFAPGISYAGLKYEKNDYGAAYYLTRYYQGESQTSGMINLFLNEVQIRFEDDLLAYPFVGFKIYDRYRSAAMEIRYKGFMIGSNIYTSDVNGLIDISEKNKKGIFKTGKQISSPWYLGYSKYDLLVRIGKNTPIGGYISQNFWHQKAFQTPDFNYGSYNNPFLQIGTDKPYTLY